MEMCERHCYSYQSNSCKVDQIFHQTHESSTFKLPLLKLSWLDEYLTRKDVTTSENEHFGKKGQKGFFLAFYDYLPQFCF